MINKTMSRVRVFNETSPKKNLFEVILNPEKTSQIDYSVVIKALRMIYPDSATVSIECYGI